MESILMTQHLSKIYGGRRAVDDISLTLMRGDIYGLVGQNGAGKTTLIKLITGLAKPSAGEVAFSSAVSKVADGIRIGMTLEKPGLLPNFTAFDHVKAKGIFLGCDSEKLEACLELVSLLSEANTKVKHFSMGMQQRLAIGLALLGAPEVVLFDEPINGLDPQGIKWFRDLILRLNRELGMTFLLSSHILKELSFVANKYGFIHQGKLLLEISSEELKARCESKNQTLEDFYFHLIQGEFEV